MSPRVRKAVLLCSTALLFASVASAQVPDPANSTICNWVKVVGYSANGTPDADGRCCVFIRDFAGNPIPHISVEIDFSDCCDINLCSENSALSTCSPPVIAGTTDALGRFCFTATGAAKDDGVYAQPAATNGAGLGCVEVRTPIGVLARATAVAYDQDGALPRGAPGVNFSEVSIVRSLITANNLTAFGRYRGRADLNCDGRNDFIDRSFMIQQVVRANLDSGADGASSRNGCAAYCAVKVPGPNCP